MWVQVTRLGKFINLIRRKLADVDKKLSKRLKKLVKHWLQLVPPKLPNGATPTLNSRSLTTPTSGGSSTGWEEKSVSAEREFPALTNNGHTHSFPQAESPRPPSSRPYSPFRHQDSSSQNSKPSTSSSLESDFSLDLHSHSTMGNHLGEVRHSISPTPPPASPTPPYSTASSRPGQPVSVNSSKNRHKLLHKLSGFKKKSSPPNNHTPVSNDSSASSSHQPHVVISHKNSSVLSASSSPDHSQSMVQPSSPFSPGVNIALEPYSGSSSPALPWTSEGTEFFHGSGDFPSFDSITERPSKPGASALNTLNGVNKSFLEVVNSSRKRQRSDSPHSKDSSPSQKHKRRKKKEEVSPSSNTKHLEQLIVSIPRSLVTVHQHSSPKSLTKKSRSPENKTQLLDKFIVSINLSLLKSTSAVIQPAETPQKVSNKQDNHTHTNGTTYPSNSSFPPSLQSTNDRKLEIASNASCDAGEDLFQSNNQNKSQNLIPSIHAEDVLDGNSSQQLEMCGLVKSPAMEDVQETVPMNIPADALPGINGCIGRDGQWYFWTDCIPGQGSEVTVLPYIYIDY